MYDHRYSNNYCRPQLANAENEDGLTALWWAAGHTEIVELLKKAGAKE